MMKESNSIIDKYPNYVPVFVTLSANLPPLDKQRYLVPKLFTIGQFVHSVRRKIKLQPEHGVYLHINDVLCASSHTMGAMHLKYKQGDGLLHVNLCAENTFGHEYFIM
jgi:hypothetical protein